MTGQLTFQRYHLRACVEQPLHLPEFAGSMLRGAFGHALRALAALSHVDDQPCADAKACPYCLIFSSPAPVHALQKFSHLPNPYVIEPPPIGARLLQPGDQLDFSLVLIGKALARLPVVILAFQRALARGLGSANSRCTLKSVHIDGLAEPIWSEHAATILEHASAPAATAPASTRRATLQFTTPLRLQQRGHPVGVRELTARTLLIALARRQQLLADIHLAISPQFDFQQLDTAAKAIELSHHLHWHDWSRYSSRQQQEMTLGGLIGKIVFCGDLAPLATLLHAGQWLHVGKNASFGLGCYHLTLEEAKP